MVSESDKYPVAEISIQAAQHSILGQTFCEDAFPIKYELIDTQNTNSQLTLLQYPSDNWADFGLTYQEGQPVIVGKLDPLTPNEFSTAMGFRSDEPFGMLNVRVRACLDYTGVCVSSTLMQYKVENPCHPDNIPIDESFFAGGLSGTFDREPFQVIQGFQGELELSQITNYPLTNNIDLLWPDDAPNCPYLSQ